MNLLYSIKIYMSHLGAPYGVHAKVTEGRRGWLGLQAHTSKASPRGEGRGEVL